MKKLLLVPLIVTMLTWTLGAQDIHYTQYMMSPLLINPANTGNFEGTFRVGGLYRNQWATVLPNAYRTPSAYYDMPLMRGIRESDWIGIGFQVFSDKAGEIELNTSGFFGSVAYHVDLNQDGSSIFSFGIQGGTVSRYVDANNINFFSTISGGQSSDPTSLSKSDASKGGLDFSAGASMRTLIGGSSDLTIGVSAMHITQPDVSVLSSGTEKLPMKFIVYGEMNTLLKDDLIFTPSVLFQKIGPATEFNIQGLVGLVVQPENNLVLNVGAGIRVLDAVQVLARLDYGDLSVGVGYDINTSKLTPVSTGVGGIELAVAYIARIYPKPKVEPIKFCPGF